MRHDEREEIRDDELRETFRRAREVERAEAPAYRELVQAGAEESSRPGRPLVWAAVAAAGLTLAVAGVWLPLWRETVPQVEVAQSAPPLAPPPAADVPLGAVEPAPAPPPPPPPSPEPAARKDVGSDAEKKVQEAREEALRLIATLEKRENELAQTSATPAAKGDGQGSRGLQAVEGGVVGGVVGGVANVSPLTGQQLSQINSNSIEEMEVIVGKSKRSDSLYAGPAMAHQNTLTLAAEVAEGEPATQFNTESYAPIAENDFQSVSDHPLSTFSIDVDTASWANVRRFLRQGRKPPADAVRIEEMVNYFSYDYPPPSGRDPFSATVEVADCPWAPGHRLARIGLKGRDASRSQEGGSNLVFLIDVSGSMDEPAKLPLVQQALALLADQLDGRDRVAIVVYAGASGLVLPSTSGASRGEIREAIERLRAGGGTNGASGLRLAYETARANFIKGGINRVILATDGDFNLGVTSKGELLQIIEADAKQGVFLTALGFGMGNYKDDTLELLADKGNGNYAYIDDLREAQKVLVEEVGGTLVTIAKDVKIQVEFNPARVGAYRLIGYENRMLHKEDFNDDRKDAGEIGAGHTVTALYEILPPGEETSLPAVDTLRYQAPGSASEAARSDEIFTLKLRYKEPDGDTSKLLAFPVVDEGLGLGAASADFKFAAAVAELGMLLRGSSQAPGASFEQVRQLAREGLGHDRAGYRAELLVLVPRAAAGER